MTKDELQELIRLVGMGRRDAADTLAELIFPLFTKPEQKAKSVK